MSKVDIVLIIALGFGAYSGYRRGFVGELLFLAAAILGILAGFHFSAQASVWLAEKTNMSKEFLPYLGFLMVFIIVVILVSLLGKFTKNIIDKTLLGSLDSAFGALIGLLKWSFFISVLLWIFDALDVEFSERWTEDSILLPYIESIAPFIAHMAGLVFPALRELFNEPA